MSRRCLVFADVGCFVVGFQALTILCHALQLDMARRARSCGALAHALLAIHACATAAADDVQAYGSAAFASHAVVATLVLATASQPEVEPPRAALRQDSLFLLTGLARASCACCAAVGAAGGVEAACEALRSSCALAAGGAAASVAPRDVELCADALNALTTMLLHEPAGTGRPIAACARANALPLLTALASWESGPAALLEKAKVARGWVVRADDDACCGGLRVFVAAAVERRDARTTVAVLWSAAMRGRAPLLRGAADYLRSDILAPATSSDAVGTEPQIRAFVRSLVDEGALEALADAVRSLLPRSQDGEADASGAAIACLGCLSCIIDGAESRAGAKERAVVSAGALQLVYDVAVSMKAAKSPTSMRESAFSLACSIFLRPGTPAAAWAEEARLGLVAKMRAALGSISDPLFNEILSRIVAASQTRDVSSLVARLRDSGGEAKGALRAAAATAAIDSIALSVSHPGSFGHEGRAAAAAAAGAAPAVLAAMRRSPKRRAVQAAALACLACLGRVGVGAGGVPHALAAVAKAEAAHAAAEDVRRAAAAAARALGPQPQPPPPQGAWLSPAEAVEAAEQDEAAVRRQLEADRQARADAMKASMDGPSSHAAGSLPPSSSASAPPPAAAASAAAAAATAAATSATPTAAQPAPQHLPPLSQEPQQLPQASRMADLTGGAALPPPDLASVVEHAVLSWRATAASLGAAAAATSFFATPRAADDDEATRGGGGGGGGWPSPPGLANAPAFATRSALRAAAAAADPLRAPSPLAEFSPFWPAAQAAAFSPFAETCTSRVYPAQPPPPPQPWMALWRSLAVESTLGEGAGAVGG